MTYVELQEPKLCSLQSTENISVTHSSSGLLMSGSSSLSFLWLCSCRSSCTTGKLAFKRLQDSMHQGMKHCGWAIKELSNELHLVILATERHAHQWEGEKEKINKLQLQLWWQKIKKCRKQQEMPNRKYARAQLILFSLLWQ